MKKTLKFNNLIPITYWFKRYTYPNPMSLVFRVLSIYIYMLLSVYLIELFFNFEINILNLIKEYILVWLLYVSLYEIGYFMNDFWSEKREEGNSFVSNPNKYLLFISVLIRIIVSLSLVYILHFILPSLVFKEIILIVFLIQLMFLIHNLILYPYRVFTFFLLYLGRFLLLLPLIRFEITNKYSLIYLLLIIPIVFSYSLKYAIDKDILNKRNIFKVFNFKNSNFILRFASFILLLVLPFAYIFSNNLLLLFSILIIYLLLIDLVFIIGRYLKLILNALNKKENLYHVHTKASHDSNLTIEKIYSYAKDKNIKKVFLTDHAEDLNKNKFIKMKKMVEKFNNKNEIEIIMGLEYDILGQHFLAIGLRKYIDINKFDITEMKKIKGNSNELFWAHPHFKIKNWLSDKNYRKKWYKMMEMCDGMEVFNLKSSRGVHFKWRHLFLSFIAIWLGYNNFLFLGTDAHDHNDLP